MQAAILETDARTQALRVLAAADRTQRELGAMGQRWTGMMQPTAALLGQRLQIPEEAVEMFSEEVSLWNL